MPDKVTIQRRATNRVGIFVDMQNLYHSAKNLYGSRINFAELYKLAAADRQVVRALAYVVKGGESEEEKAFFDALEKSGLELKMKDLQVFAGGAKKADWDVGLAVDAISMSRQVDVVVIVSGDGDFVPLVEYLQHMGTIVEAVSFGRSTSMKLKEVVNNYTDLDQHRSVLRRPGRVGRATGRPAPGEARPAGRPVRRGRRPAAENPDESADQPTGEFMPPRTKLSE